MIYEEKRTPSVPTGNFQIGGRKCNFQCPWCISHLTTTTKDDNSNIFEKQWRRNLDLAFARFEKSQVKTILITSKGEPLLWMEQVFSALDVSRKNGFVTELQTNGYLIDERLCVELAHIGLNTIAISRYSVDVDKNLICGPKAGYDLEKRIEYILKQGMNVRLTFLSMLGKHSTYAEIEETCRWARNHDVSQVTFRKMGMPSFLSQDLPVMEAEKIRQFIIESELADETWERLANKINNKSLLLQQFDWGSVSWLVEGVECLLTNCLSVPGIKGTIRYLIYCPDGHMRYMWEVKNAIIF